MHATRHPECDNAHRKQRVPENEVTRLSIRYRVDFGESCAIGPGKIALLEAIARSGSLSQAARELGMSYRRAWLLLDSLNSSFRQPVTEMMTGGKGGGGATLTPFGTSVIQAYRAVEAAIAATAERSFRSIAGAVTRTGGATLRHPRLAKSPPPTKGGK